MDTQPYGIGVKLDNTGLVRFVNGTLERIRRDGTWNTLYRKWLTVLGPAPAPPTEVRGLMAEQPAEPDNQDADDVGPGTQPADSMVDTSAQSRPIATQAIFRPEFDDDEDFLIHIGDTAPTDRTKPRRGRRFAGWAAGWSRFRGCRTSIRSKR